MKKKNKIDFKGIKFEKLEKYSNYAISRCGEILSLNYHRQNKFQILKTSIDKDGYKVISLSKNSIRKTFKVHRLVAEQFILNTLNKSQVNHKDGIKSNNNVDNLEFVSCSENALHAYKLKLRKNPKAGLGKFGILNSNAKKVNQYDLQGNFIRTWDSMSDVQRELKILRSNISLCCKGIYTQSGNYIWRLA